MLEGLFIVIYGINNIGKSTQVELLLEVLNKAKLKVEHLKYPIYDLQPTGPKINEILRSGGKQSISEEELQELYTQNRRDFQPQLCKKIDGNVNIIAEDYVGTGLAWGLTKGADLEKLIKMNNGLVKPDIEILLDGERFLDGQENNHLHESNDKWLEQCRKNFLELAARFNWLVVNANQEEEDVHQDIIKIIEKKIKEIKQSEVTHFGLNSAKISYF
jgi:thymidylate kinase